MKKGMGWLKQKKVYLKLIPVILVAFIFTMCLKIDRVVQPETATAGETITMKMEVTMDPATAAGSTTANRLVIAILVPKSWNAKANTSMTYTSNVGGGTMSLIPASVHAPNSTLTWPEEIKSRLGIGANVIDEVEWVAFWSAETYDVAQGGPVLKGEITIQTKVGSQNLISQLGYFFGSSELDLSTPIDYNVAFTPNFEVTGGAGATIDYTRFQVASVSPLKSLDNDFITVIYDAKVGDASLMDADAVYMCAKAYDTSGAVIEVCGSDAKNSMVNIQDNKWRIDLWPRSFFSVSGGQTLDRIEYSFKNEAGDIEVIDPNTGTPFIYTFECN